MWYGTKYIVESMLLECISVVVVVVRRASLVGNMLDGVWACIIMDVA